MQLKSFGCSFIFGTDLQDNPSSAVEKYPCGQFSRLTWPALLASQLKLEYTCYARPGSGNLQIAERVLNEHAQDKQSLYVIDWTWIDRFDYIKSTDTWQPWATVRPSSDNPADLSFYKHLHSEYTDKLQTLLYVKVVLDQFLQHGTKFIMTYEDSILFDQRWHISPAVIQMQNTVRPHMTTFEDQGFLEWSRSNGYPISSTWHPLEQAHEAAANLMVATMTTNQQ